MAETVSPLANGTEADRPVLNTIDILLLISNSIYFVIEVTLNSFIITVLVRERDLESTQIGQILYQSLASVDIVYAILYRTFAIIYRLSGRFFNISEEVCLTVLFLTLLSYNVSAWMLFAIALNKFIFIKYPLRYFRIVTLRRMVFLFAMMRGTLAQYCCHSTFHKLSLYWSH